MESFRYLNFLTLLLFINLFHTNTVVSSFGNETDRLALLKFKESIVGDPHGLLNSWNDSVHFCKWRGITCGRRHQRVTTLNLQDADLHGTISPYIGNLSFLRTFRLSNNSFSGKIPHQVDHLFQLQSLNLTFNMLEGEIPVNLTFCLKLSFISIGANRLTGKIPSEIGSIMNLVHLNLWRNNLTGGIPPSLGNLSSIHVLSLAENNLGGTVPVEIGRLRNLRSFNTNSCNLTANFSTQLTGLNLGDNQIVGTIPETLGNLNSMGLLALHKNLFTGIIPFSFGKLQNLQVLALNTNRLSGEIPSSLGNLTQLFVLRLYENELEGSIPPTIGYCKNLQILNISQNKLSGDVPPEIIGLSSLLNLDLSQNSLTGSLPDEVSKLKNIYHLDISGNNLVREIPETIGECESLEFLSLRWNLIQGTIPSSLASVSGLQYLDLSQNNLSGEIPKELQRLPFLIYLNLSSNHLEGEVPKGGVFQNMSAISLDGNAKLCGHVSELHLPACPIKVPKQRKLHGFKLKLTISVVVGCSVLFAVMLALYWKRKIQKKEPPTEVAPMNFLSKVSYQTLHQATGGFSPSNQIGSGGFGSVYKGILDQQENCVVAIKVLNLKQKGASKSFVAECNALRNIRHRNLVKIITCCSSTDNNGNDFKALIFECMSNGSLEEWLHRENHSGNGLNLLQRLNIAVDVASALCYFHDHCEPQIIHCDIKPSNILLDDDMAARVGDFGLARLISVTTDSSAIQNSTIGIKGTIGYAAPEYASGVEPSREGDVYSYGVLLLQMFTGRRPTDEMFNDDLNLHNFVKMAIPGRLLQIVDPALLASLEVTAPVTTQNEVSYTSGYNNDEIEADEDNIENESLSSMNTYAQKCILITLKIGLACSEESPRNRMSMEEVHRNLHRIKNAYNGINNIRRERPRRS